VGSETPLQLFEEPALQKLELAGPRGAFDLDLEHAFVKSRGPGPASDAWTDDLGPRFDRLKAHEPSFETQITEQPGNDGSGGIHAQPASGSRKGMIRQSRSSSVCVRPPTGSTTPAPNAVPRRSTTFSLWMLLSISSR